MGTSLTRQGELAGWLKDNNVTIRGLAAHCGKSPARISTALKGDTVPEALHADLRGFRTEKGLSIPVHLLPEAMDRKPGPEKGWLEDRLRERTDAA